VKGKRGHTLLYAFVRKARRALAESSPTNPTRLIPVQTPERMDLVESVPRPPRSFRRFLAGRISTDAERFRIYCSSRTDILGPGVHTCARVSIYRPGTNLQVKLLSRSVSTVRFRRVHPSRRAHYPRCIYAGYINRCTYAGGVVGSKIDLLAARARRV